MWHLTADLALLFRRKMQLVAKLAFLSKRSGKSLPIWHFIFSRPVRSLPIWYFLFTKNAIFILISGFRYKKSDKSTPIWPFSATGKARTGIRTGGGWRNRMIEFAISDLSTQLILIYKILQKPDCPTIPKTFAGVSFPRSLPANQSDSPRNVLSV